MSILRIVGIGGGTGLPMLLQGLAGLSGIDVAGIVGVTDNGGSSGRLREDFIMPAVGDLRNCLVALSEKDSDLAGLFQHRFSAGDLDGHALGNLVVAALYQRTGSLSQTIELLSRMLRLQGHAIAATEVPATLCAALRDGRLIRGESQIAKAGSAICRIWLEPEAPPPCRGVLDAIRSADAIVFAPGSLYTSLLPNLLIDGVANAIQTSAAARIMVCNIMTQPGETDGFSASDHLREVRRYLDGALIHYCLMNSATPASLDHYLAEGSRLVRRDVKAIASLGAVPVSSKLIQPHRDLRIRHNPEKLGRLVAGIAKMWAGRAARAVSATESMGACRVEAAA